MFLSSDYQFLIIKRSMKNLGVTVLTKIQNLISEIDNPKNSPKARKKFKGHSPHSHGISMTQSQYTGKQMSYNYLNKEKKTLSKLIENAYDVQSPIQPFKVTNKHSLSILKRMNLKPIYERLEQITTTRKIKTHLKQQQLNNQQDISMVPIFSDRYTAEDIFKKYRKMNEGELTQFRNEYDEKNHERLKKKHIDQLSRIQKEIYEGIPIAGKNSTSLSKLRNLKKNYSIDVFKRLNQDYIDRGGRKTMLVNRVVEEEGGFQPVLCTKSRILAEKYKNNRSFSIHNIDSHKKCKTPPVYSPIKRKQRKISPDFKIIISKTPKSSEKPPSAKPLSNNTRQLSKSSVNLPPKLQQKKRVTPIKPQSTKNRLFNALKDKNNSSTAAKSPKLKQIQSYLMSDVKSQTSKKQNRGVKPTPFHTPREEKTKGISSCPYHASHQREKSPQPSSRRGQQNEAKSIKR